MWVGETHISLALHGHQMDVSMRNLKSQYALPHLDTRYCLADGNSHLLGKNLKSSQFVVRQIKDIIHLTLGDHQCMSLLQRTDVQESKILLVFCYLVARNLSCHYSGKYACHDSLLTHKRWIPPGVVWCPEEHVSQPLRLPSYPEVPWRWESLRLSFPTSSRPHLHLRWYTSSSSCSGH